MNLTPEQIALKEAAQKATPGPWLHRHDPGNPVGVQHGVKLAGEFGAWVCDCLDNADRKIDDGVAGARNAAFIALANPATILALIAQVEAAPEVSATAIESGDCLLCGPHGICGYCPVEVESMTSVPAQTGAAVSNSTAADGQWMGVYG